MLIRTLLLALLFGGASGAGAITLAPGECPSLKFDQGAGALPLYPPGGAVLVIIIDDIGYQRGNGETAIDLPGKLNYAVLPYTPHGRELAERAHQRGKEVLLHAPMSNLRNKPLGRGALTRELSREQFSATLTAALAQIPHVRGVNNHMGSALTQQRTQMRWLMDELARRQLYFVDSRTDRRTVAAAVATERQVPNLSRQVFLDNQRSRQAIAERFQHLTRLAREQGLAVGIGHPYPETIAFLREVLPGLQQDGFRLALASEVLEP